MNQYFPCPKFVSAQILTLSSWPMWDLFSFSLLQVNNVAYHQFCSKPEWFTHSWSVPRYLSVSNLVWFYHLCPRLKKEEEDIFFCCIKKVFKWWLYFHINFSFLFLLKSNVKSGWRSNVCSKKILREKGEKGENIGRNHMVSRFLSKGIFKR